MIRQMTLSFCIILCLMFVGCSNSSKANNQEGIVKDFEHQIDEINNEIISLKARNSKLTQENESLNLQIDKINSEVINAEKIFDFTIKESSEYVGYYNVDYVILYSLPTENSVIINRATSNLVEVISIIKTESNDEWALVKSNDSFNMFGYMKVENLLEKIEYKRIIEDSTFKVNSISIGSNLDKVISNFGTNYRKISTIYGTGIEYDDELSGNVLLFYNSNRQIYKIHFDSTSLMFENGLRIGLGKEELLEVLPQFDVSGNEKLYTHSYDTFECSIIFNDKNEIIHIELISTEMGL